MLMRDFRKEICDDMFMQCDIERDISTMKNSKFEQQYARTMSNELWIGVKLSLVLEGKFYDKNFINDEFE